MAASVSDIAHLTAELFGGALAVFFLLAIHRTPHLMVRFPTTEISPITVIPSFIAPI